MNSKRVATYLTSDIVVFNKNQTEIEILLIQRENEPFKNYWALPGGFLDLNDQNIKACAKRELEEETGLKVELSNLVLIGIFTEKNRDPRENLGTKPCRVCSAAFSTVIQKENHTIKANDDAKMTAFFPISKLPALAFDHAEIIKMASEINNIFKN